jgi:hypothetical protein
MDIEPFFTEDNKSSDQDEIHLSPSGKYSLQINVYKTLPHVGAISKGVVSRAPSKDRLFEVKRNHSAFPFCFVEDHPNGHDYLVCGADYQGQTVLELDTGKRVDYLPKGAEKGVGWCWAHITASIEKTALGVEGCFWACPSDVRFFDFSQPMKLPFLVLTELHDTWDISALDKDWSAEQGVEIEVSGNDANEKHKTLWRKPSYQEVASYWREQEQQTNAKSPFLPDIKEQAELAAQKLESSK